MLLNPSQSRMSGFRWVTTPSWLSGSLRAFLYSSSVYSWYLFLISSASVRSLLFLFFIVPIFTWNIPLVSPICLKRFLVFPILLFSSVSLHCSRKKVFLTLLAVLRNSAFSWVSFPLSPLSFTSPLLSAICKVSSENHFAFLHFFFLGTPFPLQQCLSQPPATRWLTSNISEGLRAQQGPAVDRPGHQARHPTMLSNWRASLAS